MHATIIKHANKQKNMNVCNHLATVLPKNNQPQYKNHYRSRFHIFTWSTQQCMVTAMATMYYLFRNIGSAKLTEILNEKWKSQQSNATSKPKYITYLELLLMRLNRLTLDCAVALRISTPPVPVAVCDGIGTIVIGYADGSLMMLSIESGSSSIMPPGRWNRRSRCSSQLISSISSLILVDFFFFFFMLLLPGDTGFGVLLARLSVSESVPILKDADMASNSRRRSIFSQNHWAQVAQDTESAFAKNQKQTILRCNNV